MAVTPTQVSESKFDVSVQTSDLVIVLNPLPILSALQIFAAMFPAVCLCECQHSIDSIDTGANTGYGDTTKRL